MNYQNKVVKGTDTPVIVKFYFQGEFAASGLNNFTRIDVAVGGVTYTTDGAEVWIEAADELRADLGATTLPPGKYHPTITGYSPTYPDGFVLASKETYTLPQIEII